VNFKYRKFLENSRKYHSSVFLFEGYWHQNFFRVLVDFFRVLLFVELFYLTQIGFDISKVKLSLQVLYQKIVLVLEFKLEVGCFRIEVRRFLLFW
jgi:hypothetical protein